MKLFDVIVVGGGPAGLSAALALVRAHRSVLLIDSRQYRNGSASVMQNVTAFDGVPPSDFRDKAQADLARYPTFTAIEGHATRVTQRDEEALLHNPLHKLQIAVQMTHTAIVQMAADGTTSTAPQSEETFLMRRLLLAVGVKDVLPAIPGFQEAWGNTIHVCPYCHGYEHRGSRWGLLVPGGPTQATAPGALGAMGVGQQANTRSSPTSLP